MSSSSHLFSIPIARPLTAITRSRLILYHPPLPFHPRLHLAIPHNFPPPLHFPYSQFHLPPSTSCRAFASSNNQADEEARHAVSEFLQHCGASEEESVSIASDCPRYVNMLLDGARELDEMSSWVQSNGDGKVLSGDDFGLKEKVVLMAREKGDNGKVAFLESVGLSLPSALNVARYLSSEMLPTLIYKVKYMKGLFFSGSSNGKLVGKIARRMMLHLSVPIEEDVQLTLSFFEKIEARRGGLDALGSDKASFQYLIESFPRLLSLSIESHVKPVVEFLENVGVPRGCMPNIFLLFTPIIFCNIETVKARVLSLKEIGVVDTDFGKLLLNYPWVLSKSIHDNYKDILSFLEFKKVPKVSADHAIRSWPLLLGCSTSKLKVMMDQFDELGVRSKKLGQVIARSPQLLLRKPQEFLQVVTFLEDIGFDKEAIGCILARCPEIFATNVEKTLKRKVQFLNCIGISKAHLPRVIRKYPELLVSDTDRTLFPRVKYLMEMGLSRRDIGFMVRRFSPLLGYSIEEVLRPKIEFLVNIMENPVKDVVDYPRYFSYSLEKKIKPRFWVLKGRNVECSLKDMLGKNDEEFAAEFIGLEGMLDPISSSQH